MLCTMIEAMFGDVLMLGDDSIGIVFSESQAHIMSGRVYFGEMIKAIDLLRPWPPQSDEEPDEQSVEEKPQQDKVKIIDTLRHAVRLILHRANGDANVFDQEAEATDLSQSRDELARIIAAHPDSYEARLLLPVLRHVHGVANNIVGASEPSEEETEDG